MLFILSAFAPVFFSIRILRATPSAVSVSLSQRNSLQPTNYMINTCFCLPCLQNSTIYTNAEKFLFEHTEMQVCVLIMCVVWNIVKMIIFGKDQTCFKTREFLWFIVHFSGIILGLSLVFGASLLRVWNLNQQQTFAQFKKKDVQFLVYEFLHHDSIKKVLVFVFWVHFCWIKKTYIIKIAVLWHFSSMFFILDLLVRAII